MKRVAFAIPGDVESLTGGYAYDRRMIAGLQKLGWQVDVVALGDGFPNPDSTTKASAADRLGGIAEGVPVVIDGLALGALPEAAKDLHQRNPLLALVHHPLALETGLSPERAEALKKSEQAALESARTVVVTSPSTATLLADEYDVPPERIVVVIPGTDPAEPAKGSTDELVRLLSVGAVVPRKGFDVLVDALADIKSLPWRLTIVGDLTRDEAAASQLGLAIIEHGLEDRIEVFGTLPADRLEELYAASDVFVLASHFEGYGMAFAEALAHGLPVIGTTVGAIPDTVPPDAGVLVEPNDVKALTRSLQMLIGNPKERGWFASGARKAGTALPGWDAQARLFAAAIEALE